MQQGRQRLWRSIVLAGPKILSANCMTSEIERLLVVVAVTFRKQQGSLRTRDAAARRRDKLRLLQLLAASLFTKRELAHTIVFFVSFFFHLPDEHTGISIRCTRDCRAGVRERARGSFFDGMPFHQSPGERRADTRRERTHTQCVCVCVISSSDGSYDARSPRQRQTAVITEVRCCCCSALCAAAAAAA